MSVIRVNKVTKNIVKNCQVKIIRSPLNDLTNCSIMPKDTKKSIKNVVKPTSKTKQLVIKLSETDIIKENIASRVQNTGKNSTPNRLDSREFSLIEPVIQNTRIGKNLKETNIRKEVDPVNCKPATSNQKPKNLIIYLYNEPVNKFDNSKINKPSDDISIQKSSRVCNNKPQNKTGIGNQRNKKCCKPVDKFTDNQQTVQNHRDKASIEHDYGSHIDNKQPKVLEKINENVLPKVQNSCRASTPLIARLRRHEKKNYIESSPESSICNSPVSKRELHNSKFKVPIYKQIPKETKTKHKDDLYEFDELDIDKAIHSKKKRNNSIIFDKTMHEILEKLEKKETKKRAFKNKIDPIVSPKYKNKINEALGRVMNKVKVKNVVQQKLPCNNNGNLTKKVKFKQHTKSEAVTEKNDNVKPDKCKNINVISNIRISPSVASSPRQDYHDLYVDNDNDASDSDNIDNCFGFEDNLSPQQDARMYSALSNQSVSSPIFTPKRFNANSTMLHCTQNLSWRPEEVKRNPHFIHLKPNALPNLSQEPVLEHSFVEPFEERSCRYRTLDVSKTPMQTSILDFVSSSNNIEVGKEQPMQRSLYDYEEFQIKHNNRRVLGVIQNNQLISTPKKNSVLNVASPERINTSDDGDFFGFDNSIGGNKENTHPKIDTNRSFKVLRSLSNSEDNDIFFGFDRSVEKLENTYRQSVAKPFRLNVELKKRGLKITDPARNKKVLSETISASPVNNENDDANADSDNNTDRHLFEDLDLGEEKVDMSISIPVIQYARKRQRRLSSDDDYDNYESHEKEKPKKKKKDEMSRAEKAEFDKWAKDFNAMCAEVEKHHLEIE